MAKEGDLAHQCQITNPYGSYLGSEKILKRGY